MNITSTVRSARRLNTTLRLTIAACLMPLSVASADSITLDELRSTINVAGMAEKFQELPCTKSENNSIDDSIKATLQSCRTSVFGTASRDKKKQDDVMVEIIALIHFGKDKRAYGLVKEQIANGTASAAFLHLGARLAMTLALNHGEREQLEQADRLVALAHAIEPKNPDILATQAKLLELSFKDAEAHAKFQEALALAPNHLFALLGRSEIDKRLGMPAEALAGLDKAISVDPRHLPARYRRGALRFQMGNLVGAVRDLDIYLQANPRSSETIKMRLSANRRLGRNDAAMLDVTNLLATDYNRPRFLLRPDERSRLYLQRAMLQKKRGQREKGFKDVVQAMQIAEKQSILRIQLFLRRNGYPELAITGKKSTAMVKALRVCFVTSDCWTDKVDEF